MRKHIALLMLICFACALCSCGKAAPQALHSPRPEAEAADESGAGSHVSDTGINEQFTNADGSISFLIKDAGVAAIPATMPVVQVRPRAITIEQAQKMAEVFFGDATLYEYSGELTKTEVAQLIAQYEYSLTQEDLRADLGLDATDEQMELHRRARQQNLDYYLQAYEYARDDIEPVECLCSFWPLGHYANRQWDYSGTDTAYTDELPYGFSVELQATVTVDAMPYTFHVFNREADDFRCHSVSANIKDMLPLDEGYAAFVVAHRLYSEEKPSDSQVAAAMEKIQAMVDALDIGQWHLNAKLMEKPCPLELSEQGEALSFGTGYYLEISGKPLYAGVPVTEHVGLDNMRSPDPAASNYYFESLEIRASCDGRLLNFSYYSPMELVDTWETSVVPVSLDDIKALMSAWTLADVWQVNPLDPFYSQHPAEFAQVEISQVNVGLSRVKLDDRDFLLIPTLSVHGGTTIYMQGQTYTEELGYNGAMPQDLLIIDLRSANPIQVSNPPDTNLG